jgi:hypothetical protein
MSSMLLSLIRDPNVVAGWGTREWSDVLPRLRSAGMAAQAAVLLERAGVPSASLPPSVQRQLTAAALLSATQLRSLRWELGEITRALRGVGVTAVPLKGADFLLRGVLPAQGRFVTDLDLLVAPANLRVVAEALDRGGWEVTGEVVVTTGHQLPVFVHRVRGTLLDLHHQVVGAGGAVTLDVAELLASAAPLGDGTLALLRDEDTVLVTVAHFVRNKRPVSAFRDLLDLVHLVEAFAGGNANFESRLVARAATVGMAKGLARAVRDAVTLFGRCGDGRLIAWSAGHAALPAGGTALALVPDGATLPGATIRLARLGRMYARMRSTRSPVDAAVSAWQVARGGEEA